MFYQIESLHRVHPKIVALRTLVNQITSSRKVRPVITPSGKRARGLFASRKCPTRARWESLLEQDVLRVLEVSSNVCLLRTHPAVLELRGEKPMRYTPDVLVETKDTLVLVETKAMYFLGKPEARVRLAEINSRLMRHGLSLLLLTEQDVQIEPLQDELKVLLRERPVVGRYRPGLNYTQWDPLGRVPEDDPAARRWKAAQRQCDALLARVMRRDPDELLGAAAR